MTEKKDELKTETAPLPTTTYILLGALTFQPRSGYELKALLDRSVRHFYWSPAQSQIYADLRRLVERGLVTVQDVPQAHRPDKRLVRDHRVATRSRRSRGAWYLSLLSHFPLDLISYLQYKTSISLTLLYAAWRRHGTVV